MAIQSVDLATQLPIATDSPVAYVHLRMSLDYWVSGRYTYPIHTGDGRYTYRAGGRASSCVAALIRE